MANKSCKLPIFRTGLKYTKSPRSFFHGCTFATKGSFWTKGIPFCLVMNSPNSGEAYIVSTQEDLLRLLKNSGGVKLQNGGVNKKLSGGVNLQDKILQEIKKKSSFVVL